MNQADTLYEEGQYRAALEIYKKYDDYLSLYGRGKCMMELGTTTDKDLIFTMVMAYIKEPDYLEPIGDLILYFNTRKKYHLAYMIGGLIQKFTVPVDPKYPLKQKYYDYQIELEIGIAAYYTGAEFECFKRMDHLLNRDLPLHIKRCFTTNQAFEVKKIAALKEEYPQAKIAQIMNNSLKTNIILTITSCKRLELFKKTVNSFINCNLDYRLIKKWICIDDNSTEEDRAEMLKLYPFFTFIHKTPEERGHIKSLNRIVDHIGEHPEIDYVFHLEDDWTFVKESHFILDALSILESDAHVGQVLVNRHYTQDIDAHNSNISGGTEHVSCFGAVKYIQHVYHPANTHEHYTYNSTLPTHINNTYWPHYSLRPSITRASVFRELGHFSDFYGHFENIYGLEYVARGYYSVFFPNIYCIHTGPKSGEHSGIPNSYILNGQQQFQWSAPDPPKIEGFKFIAGKDIISDDALTSTAPDIDELRELGTNPLIKVISTTGKYSTQATKNWVTIYQPNKKFPYKTGLYTREIESSTYYQFLTEPYTTQLAEKASLDCYYKHKFYGAALRICNLLIQNTPGDDVRLLQNREYITKALADSDLSTELVEYKQPKNLVGVAHDLLATCSHDAFFIYSPGKTLSDVKKQYIKYNDFYPDWQVLLLPEGMILNKAAALEMVRHNITTKDQLIKSELKVVNPAMI